jgi:hypothetical protein
MEEKAVFLSKIVNKARSELNETLQKARDITKANPESIIENPGVLCKFGL